MYLMSEDEISWTNTLYPQYQVYENRLNTFIDRSWPISLYQNEVTLAEAGFFYSGNGDIVICAFCGTYKAGSFEIREWSGFSDQYNS